MSNRTPIRPDDVKNISFAANGAFSSISWDKEPGNSDSSSYRSEDAVKYENTSYKLCDKVAQVPSAGPFQHCTGWLATEGECIQVVRILNSIVILRTLIR